MCFKKWFSHDPVVPAVIEPVQILGMEHKPTRRALLFGDNYPDTSYSLSGCLHDIDDVEAKLNKEMPEFIISKFKNAEVTCNRFYTEIRNALLTSQPGDFILLWYSGHGTQLPSNHEPDGYDEALYLNDGPFTDDKMMELQQLTPAGVIVPATFDSCFSGGMDKVFPCNPNGIKNRFHQMPGIPYMTKKVNSLVKTESKWVINAFCGEGQTCADAFFDNRANGAGTYYYLKCFTSGTSFKDAMIKLHTYLPGHGFDQDPVLLGNESLFNYKY
jgi:hypothetical protein